MTLFATCVMTYERSCATYGACERTCVTFLRSLRTFLTYHHTCVLRKVTLLF